MWTDEQKAELQRLFDQNRYSFRELSVQLNHNCRTHYSRSAVMGCAWRMGLCSPKPAIRLTAAEHLERKRAQNRKRAERRKQRRWAENPKLAMRKPRSKDRKADRAKFKSGGMSTTAASYRATLGRLPEMTKSELRDMLRQAVQNTAAMS